jgi:glycerophosphoryl diester phosphodiesterase
VSSFNHQELVAFKKISPDINTGVLIYHLPHDLAKIGEELAAYSLNVSKEFLTKQLVTDAHNRGLKLFVYTVNTPEDITGVVSLGVDGVFSNFPDRL